MSIITRLHGNSKIELTKHIENQYDKDIVEYALACYSFVLPFSGKFNFQEWIKEIKKTYDENEPHNKEVIRILAKYE